ncbi:hypothetical protein RIF29_15424 [Crotalaria pallida]|uniref:Uncharacterized protein n=1 Tax=Crotalaria pallida TaxID=3830 RepID=A0AAN9FF29_CROPI
MVGLVEFTLPLLDIELLSEALAFFGPHGATKLSLESLAVPPEWLTSSSSTAYQRHKAITFHADAYKENASGISRGERFAKVIDASQAVLFHSCKEIEDEYLNLCKKLLGKAVFPIGLLPIEKQERRTVNGS